MSLKDSKTEQNLKDAFAGESQANRRYLYFAAKADVEGYNDVAAVFRSTAEGETGHAHGHLEYLEETSPATPLLPDSAKQRALVRSFCNSICCDIHPLNNLRVLLYLKEELGVDDDVRDAWYGHWIHEGFRSAEQVANEHADNGPFVFGESVTLADCCLIPQIYNARRFDIPIDQFPRLIEIDAHCNKLPEFDEATPDKQPDAQ